MFSRRSLQFLVSGTRRSRNEPCAPKSQTNLPGLIVDLTWDSWIQIAERGTAEILTQDALLAALRKLPVLKRVRTSQVKNRRGLFRSSCKRPRWPRTDPASRPC